MRFALIGVGKHGARWAGVLGDSLIVVVDPKSSPIKLKDALANKSIDAVLIATPHEDLAPITFRALQAGKHVLCEKPGAIMAEDILALNALARRKHLVYKIGYNYRFHDGFIKARKLYEKGAIGDLLFIRASHGFGRKKEYQEWRINKETGGGHLRDQGVHMIDMARSFMGKIDKVQGMRADSYWGTGTEDNAFVLLQDEDYVIASIHSSLTQWKRKHTFEIYGTKGYLIVEGLGMRYGEPEKLIVGKRTKDPDVVKETVIKCDSVADHSLELELKEFMSGSGSNAMDAYETLKIVEEVYEKDKIN